MVHHVHAEGAWVGHERGALIGRHLVSQGAQRHQPLLIRPDLGRDGRRGHQERQVPASGGGRNDGREGRVGGLGRARSLLGRAKSP